MGWIRSNKKSAGGGGFTWDTLLYNGVVYDGGERTVSCPNIMDYDYIYIVVHETVSQQTYKHYACKCIKTTDITSNDLSGIMVGYLYGSTTVYLKITNKNSISCYYSNNQKMWVNVYGSDTNLFDIGS